jgi:hypothetical protein
MARRTGRFESRVGEKLSRGRKTFQRQQNAAACPKFPKSVPDGCERNGGQRCCMTKICGQDEFYLSAVDDQLRHADDQPSLGLLLCQERDHLTVEYALRDLKKPIGVAQWQTKLVESLPRNMKGSLPTVAEIEAELDKARAK